MGGGQVCYVDVVADARTVRSRVVITEHLRALAQAQCAKDHRHEIVHAAITESVAARAGHIEVTQRNPGETVCDSHAARKPFADDLGLTIWRLGIQWGVLGDRIDFRRSVYGCRG